MKKIIIYFFSLMIIGILCIYIFLSGIMHPKSLTLNNMKINAPLDSVVFDVSLNHKVLQNLYSPLYFNSKTNFTIKDNDYISIIFLGLDGSLNNLLSLEATVRTRKWFNNLILEHKKRHTLFNVNSKSCIAYLFLDKNNENIISYNALLFNKKNDLYITIQSDKKIIIENAIVDLCK